MRISLSEKNFAKEIAKSFYISRARRTDSIVIGINGKWGCGKSTLLKYIREEIGKEIDTCILFDFNPWFFSGQKELQTIFLTRLLEKLSIYYKKTRNIPKKLKSAVEKIEPFISFISRLVVWIKYIHPGVGEVIKDFKSYITAFDKKKPLDEIKKKVNRQIEKKGIKIFIFIDDIEGLSPTEITHVFQLIN